MNRIPYTLLPHLVRVESVLPSTWGGPGRYAPARVIEHVQVVDRVTAIDGTGAQEETSSAQVGGNAQEGTDYLFAIGDRVTIWPGTPNERTETVIALTFEEPAANLPAHQIAYLS